MKKVPMIPGNSWRPIQEVAMESAFVQYLTCVGIYNIIEILTDDDFQRIYTVHCLSLESSTQSSRHASMR